MTAGRVTWQVKAPEPQVGAAFRYAALADLAPLDAQLGVRAPVSVPEGLDDPLFGPDALGCEGQHLNTYAVLDAAKLSLLPDMIEAAGTPHACLFQGEAAETLRESAPWLVALSRDDRLTRALMTDCAGPIGLWAHDLGLIIRCAASFEAMCKHLRRFVRLRDAAADAWYYFRFWERHVPLGLASAEAAEPQALAQALIAPIDGAAQSWIMIDPFENQGHVLALQDTPADRIGVPALSSATVAALEHCTAQAQMRSEIHDTLNAVPEAVRDTCIADPRLARLWQVLHDTKVTERDQRIEAMQGYLRLTLAGQEDRAWDILNTMEQGPKIRLWHLSQALEAVAA